MNKKCLIFSSFSKSLSSFLIVPTFLLFATFSLQAQNECTSPTTLSGSLSNETNVGSTVPSTSDCGGDLSVWYEVDVVSDGTTLEIVVDELTIVGAMISIYEDDCNTEVSGGGCTEIEVADCLLAGLYYVQVASDMGDAGDFDIAETQTLNGPTNDLCIDAEDLMMLECGMAQITATADPAACADSEALGCISGGSGTWYTFTTASTLTEFTISGGDFNLFEGSCGSLSLLEDCGINGTPIPADDATTYYLLVEGNAGDVFIDLPPSPPNVTCDDATPTFGGQYTTCCSTTGEAWFLFQADFDATNLMFDAPLGTSIMIEIYDNCGGTLLESHTDDFTFIAANCGDPFLMKVFSAPGDCVDFEFNVTTEACSAADTEDICSASVPGVTLNLFSTQCLTGCTQLACTSTCDHEGVWFQVDFAEAGSVLEVEVSGANPDFGSPIISLYEGDCSTGVLTCQVADMVSVGANTSTVYFIEVANDGVPGEFEVCMTLVDVPQACADWSGVDVTRPEYPDKDPDGPYCPGETVNFCSTVDFTIDPGGVGNNCQWLQGVIPIVGEGWDLAVTPLAGQTPAGAISEWFDDVLYSPHQAATNPVLSLSTNANGLTLLHNMGGGLTSGDLLPGGWYGLSAGGLATCTDPTHPNGAYGVSGGCGSSYSFTFCFNLTVRLFDDLEACEDADLEVRLFAMADGMTGCWANTSCAADDPAEWTDGTVDCSGFTELAPVDDIIICSGNPVNAEIETLDGSDTDIWVYPIEEGAVTGAESHEALVEGTNAGLLEDILENCESNIETVTYEAYARGENCDGPPITFDVTVFPKLTVEIPDPIEICPEDKFNLAPIIQGGAGAPYDYEWRDENNVNVGSANSIDLPLPGLPSGLHTITFRVTDSNDCFIEEVIEYEVVAEINQEIIGPLDICISGNEIGTEFCAEHDIIGTISSYDYEWLPANGLIIYDNELREKCLNIDESQTAPGTYTLRLEVTDFFECIHSEEVIITISNGPTLLIEPDGCLGSDLQFRAVNSNHANVPSTLFVVQASGPPGTNGLPTIVAGDTIAGPSLIDTLVFTTSDFENTLQLFGTSAGGCMPPPVSYTIPAVEQPQFIPPPQTVCEETSVTLEITNYNAFNSTAVVAYWTNGSMTWEAGSFSDTPLVNTTYTFIGTNAFGCEITESFTVNVNPNPGAEINGSTTICANTSTELTAAALAGTAPYDFSWDDGTTGATKIADAPGTYAVTVTDANGCVSNSSFTVTQSTSITPSVSFEPYCNDDPNGTIITTGVFDTYQWYNDAGQIPGATDQTYSTSTPGNYYVEVEDSGCNGQSDVLDVQGQAPLPSQLPDDRTLCNAEGGTSMTNLDLTTLIPPVIQGFWRNENDVPIGTPGAYSAIDKPAGTYVLSFVTNNAVAPCANDTITLNIIVEDCGCPSQAAQLPDQCQESVSIDLAVLINDAGTWSSSDLTINGSTLELDENTPAGTYTLDFTHTDVLPTNCTIAYGTTFEVFAPLTVEFDTADPICNSTATMEPTTLDLDLLIVNSSVPGTWSTLETDVVLSGSEVDFDASPTGAYQFTYTMPQQAAACGPGIFQLTVNAEDCNCPRVIINAIPEQCNDGMLINLNSNTILDNPDGLPGVWTMDPDVGALFIDQLDVDGIPADTYTLTYTLSPPVMNCDAINVQSIDLVVNAVPEVTMPMEIEVCNGFIMGDPRPLELDLEGIVSGDVGTWIAPASYNGGTITDINKVEFDNVIPGEYIFLYEVEGLGACDDEAFPLTVTVSSCNCPFYPTVVTFFCDDLGDLDLNTLWVDPTTVDPGEWEELFGPTPYEVVGSNLDLTGLEGRYTLTYTPDNLASGCDPQQVLITVEAQPEITIPALVSACNKVSTLGDNCIDFISLATGAAGNWTADPDFLLTNSFNDPTNACFDDIEPGIYQFVFTVPNSNNSCDPKDYMVDVEVSDCKCPNITITQIADLCEGDSFLLSDLESTGIVAGSWSLDNPDSTIENGEFIAGAPGAYNLRFTPDEPQPTDCEPFSEEAFLVIEQLSAGNPVMVEVCLGETDIISLFDLLEAEGADTGGMWIAAGTNPDTGGFDETAATFDPSGLRNDTYEFMYLIPENVPCSSQEAIVTVEIAAAPVADAGLDQTISCAEIAELGGVGTTIGQGVTYMWTSDNGAQIDDATNQRISVNRPGIYTLLVTDAMGCEETDEVLVEVTDGELAVTVEPEDPDCFGQPGLLLVTQESGGNLQYILNGESVDLSSVIEVGPGDYTLIIEDDSGCQLTDTFSINQPVELTVDAGEDRQIELGGLDTLFAAISIDAANIASIEWIDQETGEVLSSCPTCNSLEVDPEIFNIYCVTVIDINGCEEMACVTVREKLEKDVYVPNVFSPNEDSEENKTFHVHADRFVESVNFLNIYDRWGNLVYAAPENHLPNMPEFGWNGRWNNIGGDVEPGVYVYVLEIQYVDTGDGGEKEVFSGDLTIYR